MYYKVLLVDDEVIVCDGLTRFVNWEELGYQVVSSASSVAQALVYMESSPVDLVISDIRMPIQNGLQLMEVIQLEYPAVHTIILSGYGEFEYARQALRLGASDFLTKPVNFGELKKLLIHIREKLDAERLKDRKQKEYLQVHLNHLLNSLAKGYMSEIPNDQAEQCGLPVGEQDYYIFRIRNQINYTEETDHAAAMKAICGAVTRNMAENGDVWIFNNEVNEVACLWVPLKETGPAAGYAETLVESLKQQQIEVVVAISNKYNRLLHMKEAYMEAGRALQYATLHQQQQIYRYRDIDQVLMTDHRIDEKLAAELFNLLASPEQWGRIEALIHYNIDAMTHHGCNTYEIQAFCIQILFMISQHLHSINNLKSNASMDNALYASIRIMLLSSDVASVKDCVSSCLVQLNQELDPSVQKSKPFHMIANVQRYIDEHYDQDISLTKLSNVFFIHPIYLSRLFKEKTGMNYLDYVTEVRMMHAKKMLKDSTFKVYEICQLVGYDSPRYFSKLFKTLTGMTPKEYKESAAD